jgi:hypothetical protein
VVDTRHDDSHGKSPEKTAAMTQNIIAAAVIPAAQRARPNLARYDLSLQQVF